MNFDFLSPLFVEFAIDRNDREKVYLDKDNKVNFKDLSLRLEKNKHGIDVFLKAETSLVSHVYLSYKIDVTDKDYIFGDAIERGYTDMGWKKRNTDRQMFWYAFIKNNETKNLDCFGVNVQTNSIVSYFVDGDLLIVDINTQSGGSGVNLDGRELCLCTLNHKHYVYDNLTESIKDFLTVLMGDIKPVEAKTRIYGFNNWYYAYGESNYEQIIKDTKLLEEVTKDIDVIPYMVIDDGWSVNPCGGPWVANDKFKDMAALAKEIKSHRAIPGIWFRPLKDGNGVRKGNAHPLNDYLFDPTTEETLNTIKEDVKRFVSWGYELIKLDFVTVDIYLNYGFQMDRNLCPQGWRYKDNHFTNAEIIKKLYWVIREAAPEAVLIGCNAIGHLAAGIMELNRTGDDTSGFEWERTRAYGVNSLAYRLYHNDVFYKIDGDCVGIMVDKIPWKQNKLWLDLLAKSSSPLFVSCDPDAATDEIKEDLKVAFKLNAEKDRQCEAIDIDDNLLPSKWLIDGEVVEYDWYIVE